MYQPSGPDSPAASSPQARLLTARLGRSLAKIGLTAASCNGQQNGFRIVSSLDLVEEDSGRGFTLIRAAIRVAVSNSAGELINVFENEQTRPYGKRFRNKTVRQAIEAAMDSGLDQMLAASLLTLHPAATGTTSSSLPLVNSR